MIIDSHVHVWSEDKYQYPFQPVLGYIPDEPAPLEMLLTEMDSAKVDKAVLVQPSAYGWDNSYITRCLQRYPDRFSGVCLVDPGNPQAPEHLSNWVTRKGFCGVRVNPIGTPQENWIDHPDMAGIWGAARDLDIPICVQIYPNQLRGLADLVVRYPDVIVVIDHLAKPLSSIGSNTLEGQEFSKLAHYSNVYVKVAALAYLSKEPYPFKDIYHLIQLAVDAYSPQRMVWGSDFPGIKKYCTYQQTHDYVLESLKGLCQEELDNIFYKNTEKLWFSKKGATK